MSSDGEQNPPPDLPIFGDLEQSEDAWEIAYRRQYGSVPKPDGMKITVSSATDGPREDPYHVEIITVKNEDGSWATLRSAEFTPSLHIDYGDGRAMTFDHRYTGPPSHEDMFVAFVGFKVDQLLYWSNAEHERYADIREAELAAGWDPNP